MYIPFNHQPDSISIKTSSYTIPSGKYARVVVTDTESDFTIDSVVAIDQTTFDGSFSLGAGGTKFTNTSPHTLKGSVSLPNGASITIYAADASNTAAALFNPNTGAAMIFAGTTSTPSSSGLEVVLQPNHVIYISSPSGGGTGYYSLRAATQPSTNEFWVPAGTDLDGSRYIVELYNELT